MKITRRTAIVGLAGAGLAGTLAPPQTIADLVYHVSPTTLQATEQEPIIRRVPASAFIATDHGVEHLLLSLEAWTMQDGNEFLVYFENQTSPFSMVPREIRENVNGTFANAGVKALFLAFDGKGQLIHVRGVANSKAMAERPLRNEVGPLSVDTQWGNGNEGGGCSSVWSCSSKTWMFPMRVVLPHEQFGGLDFARYSGGKTT